MKKLFLYFTLIVSFVSYSQKTSHFLNKIDKTTVKFDGIVSDEEISNAAEISLKYEISPSYNTEALRSTVAYVTYSETFLYVGIKAQRDKIISNIINRDDWAMYNGDAISIELDTYGDARNQIFLVANPSGSLLDAIRLDGRGYSVQSLHSS